VETVTKEKHEREKMKILKTKVTKSGLKIHLVESKDGKGENFALSKKYWISHRENGSATNCRYRSNSLKYLEKKFEEIN